MEPIRLRLGGATEAREKRLASLLAGRDESGPAFRRALEDAEIAGLLAVAGTVVTAADVEAARGGARDSPAAPMLRARRAVPSDAPLSAHALQAWHEALVGERAFRVSPRDRTDGPPPAPPDLIASRLSILEQWIGGDSGRQLRPAEQGALALARVMEILPFEGANGRVGRLAAAHLMVRSGARPPIFAAADRARLDAAVLAAFQLHTEPLVTLLVEASERALDVLIAAAAAEGGAGTPP